MTTQRWYGYWEPISPHDQAMLAAFLAAANAEGLTERTDEIVTTPWHVVRLAKPAPPIPTVPLPLGPSNTGLDLSHWNDNDTPLSVAQFELIKAAGHKFVWIKRTQGTGFIDPHGQANFTAAMAAGNLWIGTMHFFEWNQDGTEQAAHHSLTVGEAVGNFPELLDVELEAGVVVTDKLLAETNLRKALAEFERRFLRKPVIYTNRNYWEKMFIPARVLDILQTYKFLIADWDGPLDQAPLGLPWVHFRQKSATYTIPGIAGHIDLDEYLGDPPPPGSLHTMADKTNQQVINLFAATVGLPVMDVAIPGWATSMVGAGGVFRPLPYIGPAVEAMPITQAQKNALLAALST